MVADSVSNPRSLVKIRHAISVMLYVRMRIWSPDWVRVSVSNPRSAVALGKDENLVATLGPGFGVES